MNFLDLCLSYDGTINKKINRQRELKDVKYNAKNEPDRSKKIKMWMRFNEIMEELDDIKICWTDNVLYYYLNGESYPTMELSMDYVINSIHQKVDLLVTNYDKETCNPNLISWSLESLVGFLGEVCKHDVFIDGISEFVVTIVSGKDIYSVLPEDIRFKVGLRFCAHNRNCDEIVALLRDLVGVTSSVSFKFMFDDLLDQMRRKKNVKDIVPKHKEDDIKDTEITSFDQISLEHLERMDFQEFLDDVTFEIEEKIKQGFNQDQVSHRYIMDIINFDCLIKRVGKDNDKLMFRNGYKDHIKTLLLNESINALLPRRSLKMVQQIVRKEFKKMEGMNDVRYVINNIGRMLDTKQKN